MSFNIRYYNTKDTGEKSWEARTAAFIPMIGEHKPTVIGLSLIHIYCRLQTK